MLPFQNLTLTEPFLLLYNVIKKQTIRKVLMNTNDYAAKDRIFRLDCARKYYTPAWIKKLIAFLAEEGYTTIALHFSEDMGMRLESKRYPFLAGGDHSLCVYGTENGKPEDDGKFITQEEMAEIVKFAMEKGLDVIPAFDSPGHMNYIVKKYNAYYKTDIGNYFHKNGMVALVQGSSKKKETAQTSFSRGIDITNEEAVLFAKNLYTEYGTFFRSLGCKRFDIGGDELLGFGETIDDSASKWCNLEHWENYAKEKTGNENAVAYDAFLLYINEIADLVRSLGYEEILMWNDDVYRDFDTGWKGVVTLDPEIAVQYWSIKANGGKNPPSLYMEKGHSIYNFSAKYTYYVLGFAFRSGTTPEDIESEWSAYTFDPNNDDFNVTPPNDKVKGGGFCLWSDTPNAETEDEILEHLKPYLKACIKALSK